MPLSGTALATNLKASKTPLRDLQRRFSNEVVEEPGRWAFHPNLTQGPVAHTTSEMPEGPDFGTLGAKDLIGLSQGRILRAITDADDAYVEQYGSDRVSYHLLDTTTDPENARHTGSIDLGPLDQDTIRYLYRQNGNPLIQGKEASLVQLPSGLIAVELQDPGPSFHHTNVQRVENKPEGGMSTLLVRPPSTITIPGHERTFGDAGNEYLNASYGPGPTGENTRSVHPEDPRVVFWDVKSPY